MNLYVLRRNKTHNNVILLDFNKKFWKTITWKYNEYLDNTSEYALSTDNIRYFFDGKENDGLYLTQEVEWKRI